MRLLGLAVLFCCCGPVPFPGAPVAGAACAAVSGECVDPTQIAYCEDGKWVVYACPSECRNLQGTRCDWMLNTRVGDACPPAVNGLGVCSSAKSARYCIDGQFVEQSCGSCEQDGALTTCRL